MRFGSLDRRITLLSPPSTVNELNEPLGAWTTFARVSAEVRPLRGRALFESGREASEATVVFIIRWRAGVDTTLRVRMDSTDYQVIHVAELGRRDGIELTCTAVK